MRIAIAIASALFAAGSLAAAEHVRAAIAHYELNIPRQGLDAALKDLAQQTGLQIARFSDTIDGNTLVGPIKGNQTAEEALKALLAPQGLTYKIVNDTTIAIINPKERPTASDLSHGSTPHPSADGRDGEGPSSPSFGGPQGAAHLAQMENQKDSSQVSRGDSSADGKVSDSKITPAQPRVTLEEIVVTATKRNEKLFDVPMSLTAVSGDTLDKLQERSFEDYAAHVPGLSLNAIRPGATRLTLRGLNTGGESATVATYVDESPFGSSSGQADGANRTGDFDTFDLQRIEVLRGPQGTLYGASSLGGLLKFVTNPPDPRGYASAFELGDQSVDGGQNGWSPRGMVNIPLGNTAALRISGVHDKEPGFIKGIFADNPELDGRRINSGAKDGARASLLWQPSEALSIQLTAFGQNLKFASAPIENMNFTTHATPFGDETVRLDHEEPSRSEYRNYNGTVNWNLGWANLLSSTSYSDSVDISTVDQTNSFGTILSGILGTPVSVIANFTVPLHKFTQEVRLTSRSSDHWEWQAGAFYTHETADLSETLPVFNRPSGTPFTAVELFSAVVPSTYKEWAGFGTLTYHFTSKFDTEVGGRWARNQQTSTEVDTGLLAGTHASVPTSEGVFTYSVAPRLHLTPDTLLYGRISKGYRPGGPNILPPTAIAPSAGVPTFVKADTSVNYETGIKSTLLDKRLSLDAAVYLINWKDIQLLRSANGFAVQGNAGSARSQGLELQATLLPVRGLTLSLTGSYTDAKLTEDALGPVSLGGENGDRLPWVPKWSTSLDGEYSWPVSSNSSALFGATWSFVGRQQGDFMGTTPTDPLVPETRFQVPSYGVVNLRAGLNFDRWLFQLYAKNLGDVRGIVSAGGVNPADNTTSVTIIQPRTFGAVVSAKF